MTFSLVRDPPLHRARLLALAAALAAAAPAPAQYRPRPITEAEQAIHSGDAARDAAVAAQEKGDKALAKKKWTEAASYYEQALGDENSERAAAISFATACAALQDWTRLVRAVSPIRDNYPEDADLAYQVGVGLNQLGLPKRSSPLLQQAVDSGRPEFFPAHYYLGIAALALEHGAHAVLEFRTFLEQRPKAMAGNDWIVYAKMGQGYLLLKRLHDARAAFDFALKGRPDMAEAHIGVANVLVAQGKVGEATVYLDRVSKRLPTLELLTRLAELHLEANHFDRAEEVNRRVLSAGETAPGHHLLGQILAAQNRLDEGAEEFHKAAQMFDVRQRAPSLVALARVRERQGRATEAFAVLDEGLVDSAANVELLSAYGSLSRRAGKLKEAVDAHQRVSELLSSSPRGPMLVGADYFSVQDWDRAVEAYAVALQRDPGNLEARLWTSRALQRRAKGRVDQGYLEDAVRDLRRALELERKARVGRALGAVMLAQNRYADARAVLESATSLDGAGWQEHMLLGYALMGEGRFDAASAMFETAQRLAGNDEGRWRADIGWALARIEVGDYDAAIGRLRNPGAVPAAQALAQSNLARALIERAFDRLGRNDVIEAEKDLQALQQIPDPPENVIGLTWLLTALVRIEQAKYAAAEPALKKFMAATDRRADATLRTLVDAYATYRTGSPGTTKRKLAKLPPKDRKAEEVTRLLAAANRREAEQAYGSGDYRRAEKVLSDALVLTPNDAALQHNLACVQYLRGKASAAISTWERLTSSVPDSWLNLGMHAQTKLHAPRQAIEAFRAYIARGGWRAGVAKEWKERLESIYEETPAAAPVGEGRP